MDHSLFPDRFSATAVNVRLDATHREGGDDDYDSDDCDDKPLIGEDGFGIELSAIVGSRTETAEGTNKGTSEASPHGYCDVGDVRNAVGAGGGAHGRGEASLFSCVVNLANTVVGAGMLGLPHAFSECGWVTGFVLLVRRMRRWRHKQFTQHPSSVHLARHPHSPTLSENREGTH
jgi:hypothetical protein